MSIVNLNHTTPAAPSGNSNVTWQQSGNNVSAYVPNSVTPLTTKGDLLGYDTAPDRIPVGSDGLVLTADSGAALGVAWQPVGSPLTAPVQADWSNLNTGSMSLAPTYKASSYFEMGSQGSGATVFEGMSHALPTVPYVATFRLIGNLPGGDAGPYATFQAGWGDGTKHLFEQLQVQVNGGVPYVNVVQWSSNTSESSNPSGFPPTGLDGRTGISNGVPIWVRIIDDGTNWTLEWSQEATPTKYIVAWTGTRNTYLTATQLEIGVNTGGSGHIVHLIFDSFSV